MNFIRKSKVDERYLTDEAVKENKHQFIIPVNVKKVAEAINDKRTIEFAHIGKGRVQFHAGPLCFIVNLIEGQFPRWKNILNTVIERKLVHLNAEKTLKSVKALLATRTAKTGSRGDFVFKDNQATVTTSTGEQSVLQCKCEEESSVRIDLNFLNTYFSLYKEEQVLFFNGENNSSMIFNEKGTDRFMVMPMT